MVFYLNQEYDENPFLDDDQIYNQLNEDGNLEFIDSEKINPESEIFQEPVVMGIFYLMMKKMKKMKKIF